MGRSMDVCFVAMQFVKNVIIMGFSVRNEIIRKDRFNMILILLI
jgi:hypothetical protein